MRRFKILVPLPEIEAEDEHAAMDVARQMLANREWLDWRVTEIVDDGDERYSIVSAPDTHPDHQQFVADMEAAGLEVEHYRGRFGWEGPAVRVADLQDALGATQVQCQLDTMGKGYIVYPVARS